MCIRVRQAFPRISQFLDLHFVITGHAHLIIDAIFPLNKFIQRFFYFAQIASLGLASLGHRLKPSSFRQRLC